MTLLSVTTQWSGFQGAPGYTQFLFDLGGPASQALVAVCHANAQAFFGSISNVLADDTTVTTLAECKELDAASGSLVAIWTDQTGDTVHGGSGGAQGPAPAGMCVTWRTAGVNRGKRVLGKTFLVPISLASFQSDGTLVNSQIQAVQAAAASLLTATGPEFVIWSRPRNGAGGAAFPATSAVIRDRVAVLRSRRD